MTARVRHDDFLRRLSTGDLDPGSDEARRHFGECQTCRERWREMARLIEELEAADFERREILLMASEPSARDIERSQRAAVAAGVAAPPVAMRARPAARGPRRLVLLSLAAAAVLCAALFAVRAWTSERTPNHLEMKLGADDPRIRDADGRLDTGEVTIDYPLRPVQSLRIELEGWSPSRNENVTERFTIRETHWRPDAAMLSQFSGKVVLRVQPLAFDGQPDGAPFEREFSLSR